MTVVHPIDTLREINKEYEVINMICW